MPVSSGIITAPVSIEDISTCLGVGSYDLGTLCVSNNVNKWARHKPVRLNTVNEISDDDFKDANFGLEIPSGKSDPIEAAKGEYAYLKPRGGAYNEIYRQLDFNGYDHYTTAPCINPGVYEVNTLLSSTYMFSFPFNVSTGTVYIGLPEINSTLMECYAAIVITYKRNNTTYTEYRTSSVKIKNAGIGIKFNLKADVPFVLSDVKTATYTWVAATSTKTDDPTDGTTPDPVQTFYPLPFNSASDARGTINIIRSTGLGWSVVGLATQNTGLYSDIINYVSEMILEGEQENYFQLDGSGSLWFEIELENKSSLNVNINFGSIYLYANVTPTFAFAATQMQGTGDVACAVYEKVSTGTYSKVMANVTVPANGKKYIRVGHPMLMGYNNGNENAIQINKKADFVNAQFKYSGSIVATAIPFNLRS